MSSGVPIPQLDQLSNEGGTDAIVVEEASASKTVRQARRDFLEMESFGIQDAQLNWVDVDNVTSGTSGVGSVVKDSTNNKNLKWDDTLNMDLTTTGAGGLDTGARAVDTWYAIYIIGDTDGKVAVDIICSTSFSSPTLPTGYDLYRRVGAIYNDSSDEIRKFFQIGKERHKSYMWDVPLSEVQALSGGSATAMTAVDCSGEVPPSCVYASVNFAFSNTAATDLLTLGHDDSTLTAANQLKKYRPGIITVESYVDDAELFIVDQSLKYSVSAGTNSVDIYIHTWEEIL